MKYLIINGSPRRENTWRIVERIKQQLRSNDDRCEFMEVDLIREGIDYCNGCFSCFYNGEDTCPHSGKIQPVVGMMKKADGLIITSPVYALNVTGVMKNFIDHLAYFYHRPYFFTKKAMIVTTTAGAGAGKVGKYLDETLGNFGYNKRYRLCFINRYDTQNALTLDTRQEIDKKTGQFYEDIKDNKLYTPGMRALFYYNIWRAMAQSKQIPWDYKYWNDNNMLDSEFSPQIPCSSIRKLPFKIFYKIMCNMLK